MDSVVVYNLSSANFNHPKWIVLTTVSQPTQDVKILAAIDGWKVVVVGDLKTPLDWSYPGVVFLNVNQQKKLGYKIAKNLPVNSYTRKMIGYLYAIQNGAKYIYDTDDNYPSEGKIDFHLEPTMSGLIYDDLSQPLVNPLPHFGQSQLWPRGYPLESIAIKPNNSYQLCTFRTPAIQQGLVNGDPDVDAIYRLINKGSAKDKTINILFDAHAPPMTLPSEVFAPFNSQNTLIHYSAFWSLFLPTTVDFRVTDIWRGYWAQRLLWLIGQTISFFPPNAVQFQNLPSYFKDFAEEIQIYEDAGKLVQFLSQWKCLSYLNFFHCVCQLANDLTEKNFWKEHDSQLVHLWLQDLISIGYKQPLIEVIPPKSVCINSDESHWVQYSPTIVENNHGFRDLFAFCENELQNSTDLKKDFLLNFDPAFPKSPSYYFDNILLVLVFNTPHLQNVRMLEMLYRDHFPNILFCSKSLSLESLITDVNTNVFPWRNNDFSYLNLSSHEGWYGYECAMRAIEINYKVDGYMILGDDIMFKSWKTVPFDAGRSRIQSDTYGPHSLQNKSDEKCSSAPWAYWWGKECGKLGTEKTMNEIEQISQNNTDERAELFKEFIKNRISNDVNMTWVSFSMSDFYYISQKDSLMFSQIIKIFLKNKVYLDIAVPTTLSGCRSHDPQTTDGFPGISVWFGDRATPLKFFTEQSVYVHPLKIKDLQPGSEILKSYCNNFIIDFLDNW